VLLPDFNAEGDLPEGIHEASLQDVLARFGPGSAQRATVTLNLIRIYHLCKATGKLQRFIIFGSYITAEPEPRDVDIVLLMNDDFRLNECNEETRGVFDHQYAEEHLGASVFWARPSMLLLDTPEEFIAYWQIKRDGTRRGIVEVK
jgi:hypothetical protein